MDLGKKKSFVPDGRSEIGRRIILAGMLHHVDNVQSMPHEVDSHLHQFVLHPKKKTLNDEFVEVREAARRSNLVKPVVNTEKPTTFDMGNRNSRYQSANRKERYDAVEHYNRIHHMQRRIIENQTLQEKKKNKNDPNVYPVLMKRNQDVKATEDPTKVLEVLQKRNNIQQSDFQNSTQFHGTGIYYTFNPYTRPHTTPSQERTIDSTGIIEAHPNQNSPHAFHTPKSQDQENNDRKVQRFIYRERSNERDLRQSYQDNIRQDEGDDEYIYQRNKEIQTKPKQQQLIPTPKGKQSYKQLSQSYSNQLPQQQQLQQFNKKRPTSTSDISKLQQKKENK
ncbi:MAG: hypothetical protein EZS28_030646, partial [Streblomastix strix]